MNAPADHWKATPCSLAKTLRLPFGGAPCHSRPHLAPDMRMVTLPGQVPEGALGTTSAYDLPAGGAT